MIELDEMTILTGDDIAHDGLADAVEEELDKVFGRFVEREVGGDALAEFGHAIHQVSIG